MSAICAKIITYPWMWLFMRSPSQGAQTITYLALEPSITNVSGEYFKWVPCSLSLCLIGQIYSWASRLFAEIKNPPLAVCLVLIKLLIASFIYQPSLLVFVELFVSRKILAHFSSPSAWKSPNNLPVSIRVLIHLFSLSLSLCSDCERKDVAQLLRDPAATEQLIERLVKASLEAVQVPEIKL